MLLRCAAPFTLTLLLGLPATSWAACNDPLPTESLRALDARIDGDPVGVVAEVNADLQSPQLDPLQRAELFAILASAYDATDDDVAVRAAIEAGRAVLGKIPQTRPTEALSLRFALVEASAAQARPALETAVKSLDAWEQRVPGVSLARACVLLMRSRVNGRLNLYEEAARDGLFAHSLASQLQIQDARTEAAYQLAVTLRRAGLFDSAREYIDEAIIAARATGARALLASAAYVKGQILAGAGQYDAALSVVRESRQLSVELNNDIGRAFADNEVCATLIDMGRLDDAESVCRAAEQALAQAGRADQAALATHHLAAVDLHRGRPHIALARLDGILGNGGVDLPPAYLSSMYRRRSDAYARLGRVADAYASLRRANELHEQSDVLRRSLAVAVMNAQRRFGQYEREQAALSEQLSLERQRAANREATRRLALLLAASAVLLAALLAYLLWSARRFSRALLHQETILRTTTENSPDALVLLDVNGSIRFASRALVVGGRRPERGGLFEAFFPPAVRPAIRESVEQVLRKRVQVEQDIKLTTNGEDRQYELRGVPIVEQEQLLGAALRISDVTERRSTEKHLLEVISRERQRMSSQLHEGLGQELTGISLQLRAIATKFRAGRPIPVEHVDEATGQMDHAIALTRDLARGLSPTQADRGSLSDALSGLAEEATQRWGLRVTARSTPPEISAPEGVADQLYRIAFEAVSNAARHASARQVEIRLCADAAVFTLTVSDDGCGFSYDAHPGDGWGLRMMRYRAQLLGGSVKVESAPGRGTRIVTTAPTAPPGSTL